MPRYTHECPKHGEFEVVCSMTETLRAWPCRECGEASRKLVRTSPAQFHLPAHFRTTLPTTGLVTGAGGSGEFENLKRDFNRWDSGASGIRDPLEKQKVKERRKKLVSTPTGAFGGSR
jgi:hypothetical protein